MREKKRRRGKTKLCYVNRRRREIREAVDAARRTWRELGDDERWNENTRRIKR